MMLSLIVAMDRDGVIGDGGKTPWHAPVDLARFRNLTLEKWLVLGRKTWEGIRRPLPGRHVIIVSREEYFVPRHVPNHQEWDTSLSSASELQALLAAGRRGDYRPEMVVAGGAEIYKAALPHVQRMYLTVLDGSFPGVTHFPAWNQSEWVTESTERVDDSVHPHTFSVLTKRSNACI